MIYNPLLLRALILGSLLYASAPKGSYMGQSGISVRMRGVSFLLAGLWAPDGIDRSISKCCQLDSL